MSFDPNRTVMGSAVTEPAGKIRVFRLYSGHEQSCRNASDYEWAMSQWRGRRGFLVVECEPKAVRATSNGMWRLTHIILKYEGARQKCDFKAYGEVWEQA